jgi:hypothetical protein
MLHLDANACERLDSLAKLEGLPHLHGPTEIGNRFVEFRRAFFCGLQYEFAKRLLQSSKIPHPLQLPRRTVIGGMKLKWTSARNAE